MICQYKDSIYNRRTWWSTNQLHYWKSERNSINCEVCPTGTLISKRNHQKV